MNQRDHAVCVRHYFEYLTASNYATILDLFDPDGEVDSPYLGRMRALTLP